MKPIITSLFLMLFLGKQHLDAYALFVFGPRSTDKNWLKNSTKIYDEIKSQLATRNEMINFYPQKVATGIFASLQTKYSQQELTKLYHNSLDVLAKKLAETIIITCEKLTPTATLSLISYGGGVQVIQRAI